MSNSYRIRTQVGVDKSINVQLEQDFEFLEILSLKITQSQIYTRQCSDYGVVVGRLTANDGFGIPNARISVFIPLSDQDQLNPIISDLYPYRSLTTTNDDGFRYNLLPKTQSHSGHVPVGSFFDKEQVLLDPNYIEVFDKYYRYTTITNDSGDYMIFGVPLGSQTIHVDVDLSDIGEFSLAPQDLIRNGIATENQVAGTKFRKSTNLNELPQIVSFNRTLEVVPLWGQPEVCSLGITRTDFDLATEANVTITPTAIFMGSIFSTNDKDYQRRNCKPKSKQGELCNLVAGPGEILAIRQTIFEDEVGRPILETYDLESGGQVIDENGAWLVDVPMNLDYVITNKFGEKVLSNDPKKGIPTKGKYRFKIKWNQSPKLSENIKRAYFLVPNVREYGWNNANQDPLNDLAPPNRKNEAIKSYAFSVDWNDYGDTGTTEGRGMIQAAINCEDRFYPMVYNKVYSISQLIDQYRNGYLPDRIISVKNILDDTCESENVRFPTNDSFFRFDIIYILFIILIFIARPILYIFLHVAHFLAWVMKGLSIPGWRKIAYMEIPNLTYPECDLCECSEGKEYFGPGPSELETSVSTNLSNLAYITPLNQFINFDGADTQNSFAIQQLLAGGNESNSGRNLAPQLETFNLDTPTFKTFTNSLPMFERINMLNVKAKYFDWLDNSQSASDNPGGGWNRIKVNFRPTENGYPINSVSNFGPDNLDIAAESGVITVPTTVSNVTWYTVPINIQTQTPPLNPNNPYNTTNYTYTVQVAGTYRIDIITEVPSQNNDTSNYITYGYKLKKNNQVGTGWAGNIVSSLSTPSYPANQTVTYNETAVVGDTFSVVNTLLNVVGSATVSVNTKVVITFTSVYTGFGNRKYHLDNSMMLMVKPDKLGELRPGTILSFQNPELSNDVNLTGYTILNQFNTPSSTGQTINQGTQQISVPYANPNGSGDWFGPGGINGDSHYTITQGTNDAQIYNFPSDIEYFQVITAMTWQDYVNQCYVDGIIYGNVNSYVNYIPGAYGSNSPKNRVFDPYMFYHVLRQNDKVWNRNGYEPYPRRMMPFRNFRDYNQQVIVFMVRGVDPYSTTGEIEYDLSRLFGYPLDNLGRPNGEIRIRGNYKLNIPIRGKYTAVRHDYPNGDITIADTYTNQDLYYPSYHFRPSITGDARFSGFSSNLPSYYSSLGTNTPINYLQGTAALSDFTQSRSTNSSANYLCLMDNLTRTNPPPNNSYNVRDLKNGFMSSWTDKENLLFGGQRYKPVQNNIRDRDLRVEPQGSSSPSFWIWPSYGYYPREIVDGGSIMGQIMRVESNVAPFNRDLRAEAYYYSPAYSKTNSYSYNNCAINNKIIMRSDRLPTSTSTSDNLQNSYAWQANINFGIFIINPDGTFAAGTGSPVGSPTFNFTAQTSEENYLEILDTFSCQSLVPLECYRVVNTEIDIRPSSDSCYTNGYDNQRIMKNGCYVLITAPFESLEKDIQLLWEWTSRIQINFAACRNVFSHIFTNNWINGSLYAFAFQNTRVFDENNVPFSLYCTDTVFLHPSNNFYYRASPYYEAPISGINVGRFVGAPRPSGTLFGISYGGNSRYLKTPTTMIDLGPRSQYTQELVFSNEFDGYIMNRMKDTSFQDVSELLNLMIINRLTNQSVLQRFLSRTAANVLLFFDRRGVNYRFFIDGDYAQAISINSELGVIELSTINYPPVGGPNDQDPIFFSYANSNDPVIGIFFSSDTQTRDFISPKRTILNPNLPLQAGLQSCSFENFSVFSQEVPFYQWEIREGNGPISIFGGENNNWYTTSFAQYYNDDPNLLFISLFKYRYQSLDRLYKQSRYYRPSGNGNPNNGDFKGYIYSIDRNQTPPELEAPYFSQQPPNDPLERVFQVGAPYFFYFGLKKGKTAFDRFAKKWIDFNNFVE